MAGTTSNIAEIAALMADVAGVLNLRRGRGGKSLGSRAADRIALGIQSRTLDNQKAADGGNLKANRGDYGKRKRSHGILVGVGLYGGEASGVTVGGDMLSLENLRGMVAIGDDALVMEHGIDQAAKDKGVWFTNGDEARGQPARPFYELDSAIEADIMDLMDEAADAGLRSMGAV